MLFSAPIELECQDCGLRIVDEGRASACSRCGGPFDIVVPASTDSALTPEPTRRGVWRYRRVLPLLDESAIVSLGEGETPVISLPRWGEAVGVPGASAKLEHVSPTGSFKDRGMTLVVSRARELDARALVEDSSGNAGASAGAYAARAGIPATIFVPEAAPPAKLRQVAATGATVVPVAGPREAVTEAALAACRETDAYYVGHNVNPYFSFGMTTFAYELPDPLPMHIVMPVGGGSLYVGCWLGLRRRLAAGGRMPRLHLVQPKGCAPLAAAQRAGAERAARVDRAPTIAGGAEIERPARDRQILAALRETNGRAVAVSDEALIAERRRLATLEGIDVEPTAALALAGLIELVREGVVQRGDSVLIATTGAGLKAPA